MEVGVLTAALQHRHAFDGNGAGARLSVALHTLLPLLEEANVSPDLVRSWRLRPATETVPVLLRAGSSHAQVDFGTFRLTVPAGLFETIRNASGRAATHPGTRTGPPAETAMTGSGARVVAGPQRGDARAQAMAPPNAAVSQREPAWHCAPPAAPAGDGPLQSLALQRLSDAANAASAAARLREALERSGRLSEAHREACLPGPKTAAGAPWILAQPPRSSPDRAQAQPESGAANAESPAARAHAASERSGFLSEAQREARLPGSETTAAADRTPADLKPPTSPVRAEAQPDLPGSEAVRLQLFAWSGETAHLEIRRERQAATSRDWAGGFEARLSLDMPNLGRVKVRLRLTGSVVDVSVACGKQDAIAAQLPELASQMRSRGLQPVALNAIPLD